jgi:hypothetical protein
MAQCAKIWIGANRWSSPVQPSHAPPGGVNRPRAVPNRRAGFARLQASAGLAFDRAGGGGLCSSAAQYWKDQEMITLSEVESMSKVERLKAIDLIWSTLSGTSEDLPSPDWHGKVLEARIKDIESGGAQFLTLDELKARLQ